MLPELYHAHHSRHLEDLPFWLDLAAQLGDPLLELGCGTGRVLIPLARAGHCCTGLDHDLPMLDYLRLRFDPSGHLNPSLIAADICRFNLAKQFRLVILPCNTYSTLSARQRRDCLTCVRRHLEPGGLFAVSLPNPTAWDQLPVHSDPELEDEFILPGTGNPLQVSSTWQRTRHTITVTWIYDQLFPDGTVQRSMLQARHHRVAPRAYLDEIQAAGLRLVSMYGDFDRSDYAADSPSLIILADLQY